MHLCYEALEQYDTGTFLELFFQLKFPWFNGSIIRIKFLTTTDLDGLTVAWNCKKIMCCIFFVLVLTDGLW